MMKRFLLFGITDCSDITAGASGYIGSFNKKDELVELLESKKEWIQENYIDGFNVLDSKDEEIIRDDAECSYWCLVDRMGILNNYELDTVIETIEEKIVSETKIMEKGIVKKVEYRQFTNELEQFIIEAKKFSERASEYYKNQREKE